MCLTDRWIPLALRIHLGRVGRAAMRKTSSVLVRSMDHPVSPMGSFLAL